MAAVRYLVAALACGLIAVVLSENLFWSAPPDDLTALGLFFAWLAYSAAAACALSAAVWTGCGGWRGLFLGGAILGFVTEGIVVDTMYEYFPLQLVWTPIAWHALITALWLGGAQRLGGRRGLALQVAGGVVMGLWALWWTEERPVLPAGWLILGYLAGLGLVLPLAHLVLDRLREVPRPHGAVLLVFPVVAGLLWLAKFIADPAAPRLAMPVLLVVTVWMMHRLGRPGPVSFGPPLGLGYRLSALLVPGLACAIALPLYPALGGIASNMAVALVSSVVGAGLWLWCLWQAARAGRARWVGQAVIDPR